MLERIFGNLHYKLASLVVALLAWLYVQSDEVATGKLNAQIHWELAEGLVTVQPLPRTLTLGVRGTRAAIRKARSHGAEMMVDLRDLGPGEHHLELEPYPIEGLDNLEILSRAPSAIQVQLDKQATRKVELKARVVGEPADGYAVRKVKLSPAVVEVSGPASSVNRLDEVFTEPIDVEGRMADLQIPVQLALPPPLEARTDGPILAEVSMIALNEPRTFAEVPVRLWNEEGVVDPAMAEVELTGPSTLVRELRPDEIVIFIHPPPRATGKIQVTWGGKGPGEVRVLHGAGREVRATAIHPARFEVTL